MCHNVMSNRTVANPFHRIPFAMGSHHTMEVVVGHGIVRGGANHGMFWDLVGHGFDACP